MSIRKPTYRLPLDRLTYSTMPSFVSSHCANDSLHSTKIDLLSPINTPEFIERKPMYNARSYAISGYKNIILTRYKATSINALDYDYFTVIDYKTKGRFNASDSIVRHACNMQKGNVNMNSECQVRGAFGSLSDIDIACMANVISNCYNQWKFFPNETSYDNVLKFIGLIEKIQMMKFNESTGTIKHQIESARAEIDRQRELIADLEKQENEMYEKAADAMNILEENGYDPDKVLKVICDDFYSTFGWNNNING